MKQCLRCEEWKGHSDFHRNKARKDGMATYCKPCTSTIQMERYRRDPSVNGRALVSQKKSIVRNQQYVWSYLESHPCVQCDESDPEVLEFDHLEEGSKFKNVSVLSCSAYSLRTLVAEINKCQVLCANCHRRKTNRQFNFWRFRASI